MHEGLDFTLEVHVNPPVAGAIYDGVIFIVIYPPDGIVCTFRNDNIMLVVANYYRFTALKV